MFVGSLLPFLFTGRYGIASRNIYIALPGLLMVGAVALNTLANRPAFKKRGPIALAPIVGGFVALSLTADTGMQALYAQSWTLHRNIIEVVKANAELIRASKRVEVTGIPVVPYRAISMLDYDWAFPCLVRWVTGSEEVRAWNNLMSIDKRPLGSEVVTRIRLTTVNQ